MGIPGELGSTGDSGDVGPFPGDGVGKNVRSGLVVLDRYVGVVGASASGDGRVNASMVGGCVNEEEGRVDGSSLDGVAGLRVSEFYRFRDVVGWEPYLPCWSGHRDRAVGVDSVDGPVVSVFDHQPLVGSECPVVPSGNHFISFMEGLTPHRQRRSGGVEPASVHKCLLCLLVESGDCLVGIGHQSNCLIRVSGLLPGSDDLFLHLLGGP